MYQSRTTTCTIKKWYGCWYNSGTGINDNKSIEKPVISTI
nr:MAG TPA: hypothetical protein [Caudoviricetes sp.]